MAQRSNNLSPALLGFLDKGERQNGKCQSETSRCTCVGAVHPRIGAHGNPVVPPWRSACAHPCRFAMQPHACQFVRSMGMLVYSTAPGALFIVTPRCTISVTRQQAGRFAKRRSSRQICHRQSDVRRESSYVSKHSEIAQLTDRRITCLENIDVHYVTCVIIEECPPRLCTRLLRTYHVVGNGSFGHIVA